MQYYITIRSTVAVVPLYKAIIEPTRAANARTLIDYTSRSNANCCLHHKDGTNDIRIYLPAERDGYYL